MQVGFSMRAAALLTAVGVSALALACGGGASTESGSTKPAETKATTAASSGGAGGGLAVDLGDFTLKPGSTTAKAGKVEFTVKNSGTTPHELVVLKTDADPAALTKNASGVVDEAKYPPVGRTKQIDGGKSEKLEASLAAGKYVLVCNIAGHYDLGMRAPLTVN